MRRHRLPPLNSLRAFEVAARNLSIAMAADELGVTASAVSHQIRNLEDFLGVKLFVRTHNALILTEPGKAYLQSLTTAFDLLGASTRKLVEDGERDYLLVRVALPTFSMKWLIPRIIRFQTRHPKVDVRLTTSLTPVNFAREDIDVAIDRGGGNFEDVQRTSIISETFVAVCAPHLLQDISQPTLANLATLPLIFADSRPDSWSTYLSKLGYTGTAESLSGLRFEHYYLALQATISGLGITVTPRCLVEHELQSGTLVQVLGPEVPSGETYDLLYPIESRRRPKIVLFDSWLHEEASK